MDSDSVSQTEMEPVSGETVETVLASTASGEWYLDPEALYQNLLKLHQKSELIQSFPSIAVEEDAVEMSVADKAQTMRTVIASAPFLGSANSGLNVASSAGWSCEHLEKYGELMDGSEENDGFNSYMDQISSRLKPGTHTTQSTWKFGGGRSFPELNPDKEIEDKMLPMVDYESRYQEPLRAAYKKLEEIRHMPVKAAPKKPLPGANKFSAPRIISVGASKSKPPPEVNVMKQADDIIGTTSKSGNNIEEKLEAKNTKRFEKHDPIFCSATALLGAPDGAILTDMGEDIQHTARAPYVPPVTRADSGSYVRVTDGVQIAKSKPKMTNAKGNELQRMDQRMVEQIEQQIYSTDDKTSINDVAGLEDVKNLLFKSVVLPIVKPKM